MSRGQRVPRPRRDQCPVSYTHLDVYKRQIYVKCEYLNPGGSMKDRIALNIIRDAEQKAVSYTHLDVYKRQLQHGSYKSAKLRGRH